MSGLLQNFIWVALGGALGSIIRFGVTVLFKHWGWEQFPIGTLIVNILGSLCIGIFYALVSRNVSLEPWKPFLVIGILGGFTTFSSYISDTFLLLEKNAYSSAFFYFFATLSLGFFAFILGYKLCIKI
jgi:CrcB protein